MTPRRIPVILCCLGLLLCCALAPGRGLALTAEEQFYRADNCYRKLKEDKDKLKYRDNYTPCITMFQEAYKIDPSGRFAAASLFMAGDLFQTMYKRSAKTSDREEAIDYFKRVVNRFPGSDYRSRAEQGLKGLGETAPAAKAEAKAAASDSNAGNIPKKKRGEIFQKSKADYKLTRTITSLKKKKAPAAGKTSAEPVDIITTVKELRYWSNPNYTRVVVDADEETKYTYKFLKQDPSLNKPQRLYIDFEASRLDRNIDKVVPINDNLLAGARAGQFTRDSVRVVVDIKAFNTYKIFSLRNPFRVILDVWGKTSGPTLAAARERRSYSTSSGYTPSYSWKPDPDDDIDAGHSKKPDPAANELARQLALGVRRIVIDPGHGGKDAGALGYKKGVHEKNIVLSIAKRLAGAVRNSLGCDVVLTRNSDRFLSLEERTAIANTMNADLFVSIHTNASKDRRAYGIETYFLNLATDEDAVLVAARENATSRKNISDLETILNDLMQNSKIHESSRLATHVQNAMVGHLKARYSRIKNKGVKQAPFYVLLGAQMPAILVETSFISNSRECSRLTTRKYQDHIVRGIVKGIRKYITELNPTAFLNRPASPGG